MFLFITHSPYRPTIAAVVLVVHVVVYRVEAQVPRAVRAALVERTTPVVAFGDEVQLRTDAQTRRREKQGIPIRSSYLIADKLPPFSTFVHVQLSINACHSVLVGIRHFPPQLARAASSSGSSTVFVSVNPLYPQPLLLQYLVKL